MRLFLGLLIGSNTLLSAVYLLVNLDCDFETIMEMFICNSIWSVLFSLAYLSAWLIEPYINTVIK